MKNIKNLYIIILYVLFGSSLNAINRINTDGRINIFTNGVNIELEPQESYLGYVNRAVQYLRERFNDFKTQVPIDQAFDRFMSLRFPGMIMFDAHEILRSELLSSEEIIKYINDQKEIFAGNLSKIREEGFEELGIIVYQLINMVNARSRLERKALKEFLYENFRNINPIGPSDDADLADELSAGFQAEV